MAGPSGELTENIMFIFFASHMISRYFRETTTQENLLSACFMHLFDVDGTTNNFRTKVLVLSSIRTIFAGPRGKLTEKIMSRFFTTQMI